MPEPLLEVDTVNGYYGPSHVLQNVSFSMSDEPVAVIGRNGMGKSTLCAALTGLLASRSGSVRFEGRELMGTPAYKIAAAGIGFVPQGVACFRHSPSTSTSSWWPGAATAGAGTPSASTRPFHASRTARATARLSCRVASSRCWPSLAPSCSIRGS
jgi:branched-chain amino acid transport system ATP-binding protein